MTIKKRRSSLRPIVDIAKNMGLPVDALEPYGHYMAKVPLNALGKNGPGDSRLVVVTAMTPTQAGEGKTTTAIGLVQGLAKIGRDPILTLREPSLGPNFGRKGGGTGGGRARVMPDVRINLHFTGDAHAVASAHNLLAAITEASVPHHCVEWRRVTNVLDRSLRHIKMSQSGRESGPFRKTGFDIDAASEIMAVLALTSDYKDLRKQLGRIVVGYAEGRKPITASDVNAVEKMMALLSDAVKPNLVQTLEGQPTFVHTGPFGNIAHGCNSIIADKLALSYGDIVVTEAGFGADLGFEKFMHIKTRASGVMPSAAVVVATVRAVRWHGGPENLQHAINIVQKFGLPAVVAINRFPNDQPEEVEAVKKAALDAGAYAAVESHGFAKGGEGTIELAEAVVAAVSQPSEVNYLYTLEDSVEEKVEALARNIYLAGDVRWEPEAVIQAQRFKKLGWGNLPICIAKTHMSISHNPNRKGKPEGHIFPIKEMRISAGAGFVYLLAGSILTLPGLPEDPKEFPIYVNDETGEIIGEL